MSSTEHPKSQTLRELADWLDEHPDVMPYQVALHHEARIVVHHYGVHDAAALAAFVRSVGGQWDKRENGDLFTLVRSIAPGVEFEVSVFRSQVCEQVVTGNRVIEVEEPDPAAVEALPKIKRTVTEEIREWKCPDSLLAATTDPVVA